MIFEGDDLVVYRSVTDACRHIEAPEIRRGAYEGFDSQGCPLLITADDDDSVHLLPTGRPCSPELVRRRVLRYLGHVPESRLGMPRRRLDSLDLGYLMAFVVDHLRGG